jgi:oligosaccharide repeat unit polymerase
VEVNWIINYNLALFTNTLAIVWLWKKYGISALLHPFNYYLVTWILSLLSFGVAISVGLDWLLIEDEKLLSQLFFTIAFVGSIIFIILFFSKKPKLLKSFNWYMSSRLLKVIGYAILFIGIYSILVGGFNVVENRLSATNLLTNAALAGERAGLLNAVFGLFLFLKMPILIYNGIQFHKMVFRKVEPFKFYILFVLVGSSLEIIAGGGRSGIVQALTYFGIGILISQVKSNSIISDREFIRKMVIFSVLPIILLSLYINFVSSSREKEMGYTNATKEYFLKSSVGENLFGIMEYSIFHILGYQLRINDTATEELEMGQFTFQFITTYNIPVVSQILKSEINLASLLNLKTVNTSLATYNAESNKSHSITASVFFVLYDDFGFEGSLGVIICFVLITNIIFNRFIQGEILSFYSLFILIFLFDLWKYSWFSHHLNGAIFNPYFYSVFILYVLRKLNI